MSIFNRLEDYGDNHIEGPYIELSFITEFRGIWQCRWTDTGMSEFNSEPPFESLRNDTQKEIQNIAPYVFYCTHGRLPKHLSC